MKRLGRMRRSRQVVDACLSKDGDMDLFSQADAKTMIEEGRSDRIINMSPVSGQRGSTLRAAYGMAKSAIIQLTKVMAIELAPYGIRVNAIAPGSIETRAAIERHRPTARGAYLRTISMQRRGTPKEVVAAAMYLASEAASYLTGHILNVDGGFCAAGIIELTACASVAQRTTGCIGETSQFILRRKQVRSWVRNRCCSNGLIGALPKAAIEMSSDFSISIV